MNAKNELNKIQAVLPGLPPSEYEWFDRAAAKDVEKGLKCWECDEPIELNAPYTKIELYDSPFDNSGHEEAFHVENGEQDYDSCYDRLTDTAWADFRYFDCEICNRMICRQSPRNGWHTQVRLINDDETEICLRCYEEAVLEHGIAREKFEQHNVAGMFFNQEELRKKDWERVIWDTFLHSEASVAQYCQEAIHYIDQGYKVVTDYERLGLGGGEGYVSLWIKKDGDTEHDATLFATFQNRKEGADYGRLS